MKPSWKSVAAAAVLAGILFGCGRGKPAKPSGAPAELEGFVQQLVESVLKKDQAAFLRLHLMPGDITPDQQNMYTHYPSFNKAPGPQWIEEVKERFKQARARVEEIETGSGKLVYAGLLRKDGREGMPPQPLKYGQYDWAFGSFQAGDKKWAVRVDRTGLSQRGRIVLGVPGIQIIRWKDYIEKHEK